MKCYIGQQKKLCRLNSIEHTCHKNNLDPKLVFNRIFIQGYDYNSAVSTPRIAHKDRKIAKYYYNGQSVLSYCKENGLNPKTVMSRIYKGWTIKQAIETPVKKQWLLPLVGKEKYNAVWKRINQLGWSIDSAISTPICRNWTHSKKRPSGTSLN